MSNCLHGWRMDTHQSHSLSPRVCGGATSWLAVNAREARAVSGAAMRRLAVNAHGSVARRQRAWKQGCQRRCHAVSSSSVHSTSSTRTRRWRRFSTSRCLRHFRRRSTTWIATRCCRCCSGGKAGGEAHASTPVQHAGHYLCAERCDGRTWRDRSGFGVLGFWGQNPKPPSLSKN